MQVTLVLSLSLVCCLMTLSCNGDQGGDSKGTVVFRNAEGRRLTMEELQGVTGTFRYEIVGEGNVPEQAHLLHQQARQAGQRGDHKKAISLLEQASKAAPKWPYPVYDTAYEYLLMQDFEGARMNYQKTLELSPRGFFTAITAVDTLTREKKGELPGGTYLAYLSLEWITDPGKKAERVRQMVQLVPTFAPAWKELALLVEDETERLAIIEKGLAAHPDAETKGILQINKALVLNSKGDRDGAVRLLAELALDPNSTLGIEHSAKAALALLLRK